MKVKIYLSIDVDVENTTRGEAQAVEFSLAQFSEQLEAVIESKLRGQFPEMELSFGAVEEGR